MSILVHIVEQYAEEAAFLWIHRDEALRQPHYELSDLVGLDNRVEAHIDGLRVNGEPAWEITKQQLEGIGEVGEVFAAAVLAFESGREDRIQTVLEIGTASLEVLRGLISAFGWMQYETISKYIQPFVEADNPYLRRVGMAIGAIHRKMANGVLMHVLLDPHPLVRARALRAVGELGRADLVGDLAKYFTSDDEACRFWAAWSAALLARDKQAMSVLRAFAGEKGPYRERAIHALMRADEPGNALTFLSELMNGPDHYRIAAIGAGASGDARVIPWLLDAITIPPVARVAGEAFTMITGLDISDVEYEGEQPEDFEAGPTDDPEDENVDMDPDENLPWPNVEAVSKWWEQHKIEFTKRTRYLVGKPITDDSLADTLRNGMQRQRAAAAMEMMLRDPRKGLFEVRAPGVRQQQLLGLK